MTQVVKEKDNIFSAYKLLAQAREGRDPAWLANLREKAGAAFESLDFPTTRDEEWKYTNVAQILKAPYLEPFDTQSNGLNRFAASDIDQFTFAESRESQLVFINGAFSRELSNLANLANLAAASNGCVAGNLAEIPSE